METLNKSKPFEKDTVARRFISICTRRKALSAAPLVAFEPNIGENSRGCERFLNWWYDAWYQVMKGTSVSRTFESNTHLGRGICAVSASSGVERMYLASHQGVQINDIGRCSARAK